MDPEQILNEIRSPQNTNLMIQLNQSNLPNIDMFIPLLRVIYKNFSLDDDDSDDDESCNNDIHQQLIMNDINMNDNQRAEIEQKIIELKDNLLDFIGEDEYTVQYNVQPAYSEKNVEKCISILNKCLRDVQKSNMPNSVRRRINLTVLKINFLHIYTKFGMIETMEREDIAEILNLIGYYKGAIKKDYDQTEKLRIW